MKPPVSSVQDQFARAFALHQQGRLAEAQEAYRVLLKSHHRHFEATRLLGMALLQQGDAEAAEKQIARALKFRGSDTKSQSLAAAYNAHAVALIKLRRFEEALASLDAAIAAAPGLAGAAANRGWALFELGQFAKAIAACDKALGLEPRLAAAHHTRAKALLGLDRFAEALPGFDRAIALEPEFHDAFYERSFCHLLFGNFAQGWQDAEHRRHIRLHAGRQHPAYAPASLTRGDLKNKRVLVVAEQGVGDEIMFAGMIPDLVHDAASVALECDPRLVGLFGRSFAGVQMIARRTPPAWNEQDFDCVLQALSLGRFYRNSREDFPLRHSYLAPDADIAAYWKARLAHLDGMKIGISWKGGTEQTRRRTRSIALDLWAPLLAIPGAHFVSLQYGEARDDIAAMGRALPRPITCFEPAEIDDFDRLAGLVASLDVVVTVQTALVHLSGAIGKSCKVLVPHVPEWRYGLSGNRMPWYSSVELYRQREAGEWGETITRVAADVQNLIAAASP